jgi:hypothetical protein
MAGDIDKHMKKYPKYSDMPPLSATDPEIYKFQIEHQERVDKLIAKWGPVLDFTETNKHKAMIIESQENKYYE